SADGPLLRLAAADDPDLAALAGLLLGIRARRDDRGRVEPRLPPAAREAFREGLADPSPPLCLRARAVARRADRPDLAGAAADYRTLLTRAAERLAVTGGADVALDALATLVKPLREADDDESDRPLKRFEALAWFAEKLDREGAEEGERRCWNTLVALSRPCDDRDRDLVRCFLG